MRKQAPPRRSDCPIAYALDLVGDKWTLLVLRDLVLGGKQHYRQFLGSAEKIASNILADRLKLLECAGLVTRKVDPTHARRVIYAPTEKALDLLPLMLEMVQWSARHDPKSVVKPAFVRRITRDRKRFMAEVRAPHAGK